MSRLMSLTAPLQASLQRTGALNYWHGLSRRDRLALGALGLFTLLVLLYLLLWRPAEQRVAQAREYLQQQRTLHGYLQENAPQVRAMSGKPQVSLDPARLQGLVTASAGTQGLTVERIDSQGDGGVQVVLQPTEFARLLRWLVELEEQGVRVDEAGLERADKGLVSSRLLLRSGA